MKVLALVAFVALLSACVQEPTPIDLPAGAKSVERFPLFGGNAFQTHFTLEAVYPNTPALEFYRDRLASPWLFCEWSGTEWQSFEDLAGDIPTTVHQQLYMWVNRESQRHIAFSTRYISEPNSRLPDSNVQSIAIVEYMYGDISELIKLLKLRCPSE